MRCVCYNCGSLWYMPTPEYKKIEWLTCPTCGIQVKMKNGFVCDCLSCVNSFSDDADDGTQILRCAEKNNIIVDDHGYCDCHESLYL